MVSPFANFLQILLPTTLHKSRYWELDPSFQFTKLVDYRYPIAANPELLIPVYNWGQVLTAIVKFTVV